jgi:hypothetical protein
MNKRGSVCKLKVEAHPCNHCYSGKQYALHIVSACIFSYPVCNTHASYCHLWPVQLCNIFFTLSHKHHDFRKENLLNIKCVF